MNKLLFTISFRLAIRAAYAALHSKSIAFCTHKIEFPDLNRRSAFKKFRSAVPGNTESIIFFFCFDYFFHYYLFVSILFLVFALPNLELKPFYFSLNCVDSMAMKKSIKFTDEECQIATWSLIKNIHFSGRKREYHYIILNI